MPPAPETASAPSTCSGSSLRSVEPKCSCPSNQSPVKPRPSAASRISPKGEANVVVTTSGSFQNSANIIPRIVQTTPIDPKVTLGSRRERAAAAGRAPQSPKAAGAKRRGRRRDQGPQRPRASSAQRPQPITAPSQAARSSVIAGGGRAWFSEHSADQCGALSAAPKEQDKAPHMVEDVLKTKPGPRRTSHTTRRAAWRSGRRWLPRPYGFGRRSTRQ